MPSSKYYLRTLGGLALEAEGQAIPRLAAQRKRLALMALLAAAGERGVSRDKILAFLWPNSDTERARNTLYQFIHVLKRELGDVVVPSNGDLRLNSELVTSDVAEFRASLRDRNFKQAVELYRGPFLDSVYLRETDDFERWVDLERAELAAAYASALEQLAADAESAGDDRARVRWWRARANLDPLSSRIARAYIDALIAAGDRAAALQYAGVHVAMVRSELGAEPSPELSKYIQRLKDSPPTQPPSGHARPEQPSTREPTSSTPDLPSSNWRKWRWAVVPALFMVALGITMAWPRAHQPDASKVLVAPFINRSGDAALADIGAMAADWVTQGLAESELVNVVAAPAAFESNATTVRPPQTDREEVRALAHSTGAGTIVWGTLYLVGDSLFLQAMISDGEGDLIRVVSPVKGPRTNPMAAVEELRQRTVGALALVVEPRLASLSTRSSKPPVIEAYRNYLHGLDALRRNQPREAIGVFLKAAERDTTFVLPLIWAYLAERNFFDPTLKPSARADSIAGILEAREAQLAPLDRFSLEYMKLERTTAPKEARLAALRRITALAPASNWSFLEATILFSTGRASEALDALDRINPDGGWAPSWQGFWTLKGAILHYVEDYRAELRSADEVAKEDLGAATTIRLRALTALGRVDSAAAILRNPAQAMTPLRRSGFMSYWARELRAHGYKAKSDSIFAEVLALFRSPEVAANPRSALYHVGVALEAGEYAEARALAAKALDSGSQEIAARGILGSATALLGDGASAEAQIQALEQLKKPGAVAGPAIAQAHIAGALRDRSRVLRYLAEMQTGGKIIEPAGVRTHVDHTLNWLDRDPAIRRIQ